MILREALQTPIGAKLKFSQFGFIPSPNAKEWIKIPNYHFKTKEKTVFVDLSKSSLDVLGCSVSDCRPGFYVSSLTEGGRAELLGIEMGDKIVAINGQSVDNLVTDE